MNALLMELLEIFGRGVLLLGLAFAISLLLRKRSAAFVSCYWRTAIVAVLLLPAVPTLWTLNQAADEVVPIRVVEATGAPQVEPNFVPSPSELSEPAISTAPSAAAGPSLEVGQAPIAAPIPSGDRPKPVAQLSVRSGSWFAPAAFAVWLTGVVILFGRWVVAAIRFGKLCKDSVPAGDAEVAKEFRHLVKELGLRRAPSLRTHPQLAVPMAGGLLRHRIILPTDCANWAEEDRRMTLLHELVHVRRRDALFHLFASLTKALHWANPFAWIAVRSMRASAERATDDRVLESGATVPDYARLLVEFASRQMAEVSPATPVAASAMAQPHTVESRVHRILDSGQRRARPRRFAVAGLAGCFAMLLVGVGGPALADDKSKKSKGKAKTVSHSDERREATKKTLRETIIDQVDFNEATLAEAVEYCVAKCEQEGADINVIVAPVAPPQGDAVAPEQQHPRPTLSLQMVNIPVGELFEYMAMLTGTELHIEPHSLVFRPSSGDRLLSKTYSIPAEVMKDFVGYEEDNDARNGAGRPEPDPFDDEPVPQVITAKRWLEGAGVTFPRGASAHYESVGEILIVRNTRWNLGAVEAILESMGGGDQSGAKKRQEMQKKVRTKIVKDIDFTEATLDEAVQYLHHLASDDPINLLVVPFDPDSEGVKEGWFQEPKPMTFKLKNIPFASALDYVAEFSNYSYRIDSNAVVLLPKNVGDYLSLRTIPIYSKDLQKRLAEPYAVFQWMENLGIDRYDGAIQYYDPIGNNLIVRNTEPSNKLIEDTLRRLGGSGEN